MRDPSFRFRQPLTFSISLARSVALCHSRSRWRALLTPGSDRCEAQQRCRRWRGSSCERLLLLEMFLRPIHTYGCLTGLPQRLLHTFSPSLYLSLSLSIHHQLTSPHAYTQSSALSPKRATLATLAARARVDGCRHATPASSREYWGEETATSSNRAMIRSYISWLTAILLSSGRPCDYNIDILRGALDSRLQIGPRIQSWRDRRRSQIIHSNSSSSSSSLLSRPMNSCIVKTQAPWSWAGNCNGSPPIGKLVSSLEIAYYCCPVYSVRKSSLKLQVWATAIALLGAMVTSMNDSAVGPKLARRLTAVVVVVKTAYA